VKCELKGEIKKVTYKKDKMVVEGDLEVSDSYHNFDELYAHRIILFISLMKSHKDISWKSRLHSDGTSFKDWFIAGMTLPDGDITYHIPDRFWNLIDDIEHKEKAPEWDGHTSDDVIRRLNNWSITL
jgi:hypothetical protein